MIIRVIKLVHRLAVKAEWISSLLESLVRVKAYQIAEWTFFWYEETTIKTIF